MQQPRQPLPTPQAPQPATSPAAQRAIKTASQHDNKPTSQHDNKPTSQHDNKPTSQHDNKPTSQQPNTHRTTHQPDPPIDLTADILASHRHALQAAAVDLGLSLPPAQLSALADRAQRLLCQRLGGGTYYVPSLSSFQRQERNSAIRRDYARGIRLAALAAQHHLSESRVRQILTPGSGAKDQERSTNAD